jgi:tetratricopeptide (TPR) repeat protein
MEAETQSTDSYIKVLAWLHARRKPLWTGGIAVVVIGLVWAVVAWKKVQDEADANTQFFAIPMASPMLPAPVSPSSLLEVTKDHADTAVGEYAQALAAKELFTQGKYPEAYEQFADFINHYPDSSLVPQARLGLAACLEAEGKAADAIQKYHEIVLLYPSETSIVSPAKLTLARLYEEDLHQPQQALTYYAELARTLGQNPYDLWAQEARERAQFLVAKHPELLKMLTNSVARGPSLNEMGHEPGSEPAPSAAPAPASEVAPPAAAPAHSGLNLLPIPDTSSNSTSKP